MTYELIIRDLLDALIFPDLVADELLKRWNNPLLGLNEKETIGHFLVASGHSRSFLATAMVDIEADRPIPLYPFARALCEIEDLLSPNHLDNIYRYFKDHQGLHFLAMTRVALFKKSQTEPQMLAFFQNRVLESERKVEEALKAARRAAKEGLLNKEREILEMVQNISPSEPFLESLLEDWKIRWANDHLDRFVSRPSWIDDFAEWTEPEVSELKKMVKKLSHSLANKSSLFFDMSLLFAFAGRFEEACELLAPLKSQHRLLFIEFLTKARKSLLAIENIQIAEQEFEKDPDVLFGLQYLKAICLIQLEQEEVALSILVEIQRRQPEYRSTEVLLHRLQGLES